MHSYNVFEIMEPYLVYKINVTVQQLDYKETGLSGDSRDDRDVWKTIGYAEIGPERLGQNTNQNQVGKTSGPQASIDIYICVQYNYSKTSSDKGQFLNKVHCFLTFLIRYIFTSKIAGSKVNFVHLITG